MHIIKLVSSVCDSDVSSFKFQVYFIFPFLSDGITKWLTIKQKYKTYTTISYVWRKKRQTNITHKYKWSFSSEDITNKCQKYDGAYIKAMTLVKTVGSRIYRREIIRRTDMFISTNLNCTSAKSVLKTNYRTTWIL